MTSKHARWLQTLWAKTGVNDITHLLIYHLIDVAEVATLLWDTALDLPTQHLISRMLGLPQAEAGRFVAFLVGLHDIGKASPGFQRKYQPIVPRIREVGLPVGLGVMDVPHGTVSAVSLAYRGKGLLLERGLVPDNKLAFALARVIGGHHGIWPTTTQLKEADDANWQEDWLEARALYFDRLVELYHPSRLPDSIHLSQQALNTGLVVLSGFTTVADWLGSMSEHFYFQPEWMPLVDYRQLARRRAEQALAETGWAQIHRSFPALPFDSILPHDAAQPNAIQQAVLSAVEALDEQALIILEAPTGIGKTELAFYLTSRFLGNAKHRGFYIAMPTQATSNQMLQRTVRLLETLDPDRRTRPRLLHSQAAWEVAANKLPTGVHDDDSNSSPIGAASAWFLPKKRGLLEPFAVGTVDQALLSVLWTKHFFVRVFGLARKTLVFDEVHAYDTYMTELFVTLLAWLRELDASVVILSATLPNNDRRQLVECFGGDGAAMASTDDHHSRLTVVTRHGNTSTLSLSQATTGREVEIRWVSPDTLAALLADYLADGGCAAVTCNTVVGAQEVYRVLKDAQQAGAFDDCEVSLFHSRYPAAWRQDIEKRAVWQFGKKGPRPHRAVLVATQVIEQSLDLDFDLLVSEVPPIDLLIQRIGRLHRHERDTRPTRLSSPRCLLIEPETVDELPVFDKSEYVYGRFLLLATYASLQGRTHLRLPDQSRELIESVYGEGWQELPWQDELQTAFQNMIRGQEDAAYQAALKHIPLPGTARLLDGDNAGLDEDDPALHQAFRAATRLIDPSVQVICLHYTEGGLSLEPDGSLQVDSTVEPDPHALHNLLRYVVSINQPWLLEPLVNDERYALPDAWKSSRPLKYHRLAKFTGGVCPIAGTRTILHLDREFGLRQEKGE